VSKQTNELKLRCFVGGLVLVLMFLNKTYEKQHSQNFQFNDLVANCVTTTSKFVATQTLCIFTALYSTCENDYI